MRHPIEQPRPDPIAGVEFRVYFDGDRWVAEFAAGRNLQLTTRGHGETPITALMAAEVKARKAAH